MFSAISSTIFPFIQDPAWSCTCSATLKVLARKDGKEDCVKKIFHDFNAKSSGWGFPEFMTFEVCNSDYVYLYICTVIYIDRL
jgi:hypothetical protein